MSNPNQPTIDRLNEYLGKTEVVLSVKTPFNFQCKESGTYRTRAIGMLDLVLKRVRQGTKELIYEFEPVDVRPFTVAEIGEKALLKNFVEIEPQLVAAFTDRPISYNRARNGFLREIVAAEKAKELEQQRSVYARNDQWGIF